MASIGVSILNFRAARATIACVQSLLDAQVAAKGRFSMHIYVADNASDQADQQQLRQGLDGLQSAHLQINNENLGFAAGHNQNLARILKDPAPDYVWLLNNDCLVDAHTIPALLECAGRHPEVGMWGATLLEPDGEIIQCAGGCFYSTWLSSYRQYGKGIALAHRDHLDNAHFDYLAGASLFMPASTLTMGLRPPKSRAGAQEHPWLNEEFFLFFEELDLAARLQPGLKMAWCRQALIRHVGGAGTDSRQGNRSPNAEYHSTLSALKFTWLYHPGRFWVMAPARLIAKGLVNLAAWRFDLLQALVSAYREFWIWTKNSSINNT